MIWENISCVLKGHEHKERDARSRGGIHGLESSAVPPQWKTWGDITENQGDYLCTKQMEEERTRLLADYENLRNSFGLWAEVTSRSKDILLHWQNLGIMGHEIAQMHMPYLIRTQHTPIQFLHVWDESWEDSSCLHTSEDFLRSTFSSVSRYISGNFTTVLP